jgi:hypothetical protein
VAPVCFAFAGARTGAFQPHRRERHTHGQSPFIVARDHARLYDDLVELTDDRKVRVILDRRQDAGLRRHARFERRSRTGGARGEIDEQPGRSHVVVTLPNRANSPSPDRSG